MDKLFDWTLDSMLQIELDEPDNFLKIKETLTRIGVASKKENMLYQSCHILHKRGKYYIVHFKEMYALDGKISTITVEDILRRNTIAKLLQDWDLLKILILKKGIELEYAPLNLIKVLNYQEKQDWLLMPKYVIGSRIK